jgi:signal transduction histidine kinase
VRLQTQVGIAIAIVAAMAGIGLSVLTAADVRNAELAAMRDAASDVSREVAGLLAVTQDYATYGHERAARQWRSHHANIGELLEGRRWGNGTAEMASAVDAIREHHDALGQIFARLSGPARADADALEEEARDLLFRQLVTEAHALTEKAFRLGNALDAAARASQRRVRVATLGFGGLMALLFVAFATLVAVRVLRPVRSLEEVARAVSGGDLTARAAIASRDEVGNLASAFDSMLDTQQAAQAAQRKSEEALRHRSDELAFALAEREEAIKDLAAFSYSVAHDLRAPIRALSGYSGVLLEDYGDRLDASAKGYLDRIGNAATRMERIVDGLLGLSRISRANMNLRTVNLTALAEQVADTLRHLAPERRVHFAVAAGLSAQADSDMMLIALQNLLGNAWKFTSKRADAKIEFGAFNLPAETAFYVRDNGVGFDPAYGDKLFNAFERLHTDKEFEGSGIGLATVRRIIERHRGRVWAESRPGEGATFYFTLGLRGS